MRFFLPRIPPVGCQVYDHRIRDRLPIQAWSLVRIISKFRDYYDGVMKTGMDREVVYVREKKNIVLKDALDINFSTEHTSSYTKVELVFLGYCGAVYKIYVVSTSWNDHPETRDVFHTFEECKAFCLANNVGSRHEFGEARWWPSVYQKFRDFDTGRMVELFHKFQTPLFVVSHTYSYRKPDKTVITLGPCLKDLEFQRIKDTYTAYQDIFQFVAGTLNKPENKMVKISDKDKIAKHGFDKWSFRQKGPKK